MDALIDAIIFASVLMIGGIIITGAFIFILYLSGIIDD